MVQPKKSEVKSKSNKAPKKENTLDTISGILDEFLKERLGKSE